MRPPHAHVLLEEQELPLAKLFSKGVDRPGWAAATKEIVIASEDASVQYEGKCDEWPIVGIARDTTSRRRFHVLVEGTWRHFDNMLVDELPDRLLDL